MRQYQIEVSSTKMRAAGVMLKDVMEAIERSNLNVGGKVLEENGMEFHVRGLGLIQSLGDLEKVVLMEREGTPIYLRDIATIQLGGDFRRGTLDITLCKFTYRVCAAHPRACQRGNPNWCDDHSSRFLAGCKQ